MSRASNAGLKPQERPVDGPLSNVMDWFVQMHARDTSGFDVIERSLWALNIELGNEADAVSAEAISRAGLPASVATASSTPSSSTSRSREAIDEDIARMICQRFDVAVSRKIAQLKRSAQKQPQPQRAKRALQQPQSLLDRALRDTTGDALLRSVLASLGVEGEAEQLDLHDSIVSLTNEAQLTLSMQHALASRPSAKVSLGPFVYAASRAMVRSALVHVPQHVLTAHVLDQKKLPSKTAPSRGGGMIAVLLHEASDSAMRLYLSVDINHVFSVQWSDITNAIVDCGTARQRAQDRPAASLFDTRLSTWRRSRVGRYDSYSPVPFPVCRLTTHSFPGPITEVQDCRYVLLEGRGDTTALVHVDDFTRARHVLPRHRADLNKIAESSILHAAFVESTRQSALLVAETDLHLYVYDFGPKRRHSMTPLYQVRCECATTACCTMISSPHVFLGNRNGELHVVAWDNLFSDAETLASNNVMAAVLRSGAPSPVAYQLAAVAIAKIAAHTDAVTNVCFTAQSLVLSAGLDGRIAVHSAATWTTIREFHAHNHGVQHLTAHPSVESFVSHGYDGRTILWFGSHGVNCVDLRDPHIPHLHEIRRMVYDCEAEELLTVDTSGLVKLWDLITGALITSFFAVTEIPEVTAHSAGAAGPASTAATAAASLSMLPDGTQATSSSDSARFEISPVQSVCFDYRRHKLFVRGYRNNYSATLVEGAKTLIAHEGPIRGIVCCEAHGILVSHSFGKMTLFSVRNLLAIVAVVKHATAASVGELPDPLPHLTHDTITSDHQTRSDILQQATFRCTDGEGSQPGNPSQRKDTDRGTVGQDLMCCCTSGDVTFLVFADGTIRSHHCETGRCVKLFVAQRVTVASKSASPLPPQRPATAPNDVLHTTTTTTASSSSVGRKVTRSSSNVLHQYQSPSGHSLEALACTFLPTERLLVVVYADLAIRYFSDEGTERTALRCQVQSEEDGIASGDAGAPQSARTAVAPGSASPSRRTSSYVTTAKQYSTTARSSGGLPPTAPALSVAMSVDLDSDTASLASPQTSSLFASGENNEMNRSGAPGLRRSSTGGGGIATHAVCSAPLHLAAVALPGGTICIVDLAIRHHSLKTVEVLQVDGEILTLNFVASFPCLVVGTTSGELNVFLVRGSTLRTMAHDIIAEIAAPKRRQSRCGSISPTAPSLTPLSSPRRRSMADSQAAAAALHQGRTKPLFKLCLGSPPTAVAFHNDLQAFIVGVQPCSMKTYFVGPLLAGLRLTDESSLSSSAGKLQKSLTPNSAIDPFRSRVLRAVRHLTETSDLFSSDSFSPSNTVGGSASTWGRDTVDQEGAVSADDVIACAVVLDNLERAQVSQDTAMHVLSAAFAEARKRAIALAPASHQSSSTSAEVLAAFPLTRVLYTTDLRSESYSRWTSPISIFAPLSAKVAALAAQENTLANRHDGSQTRTKEKAPHARAVRLGNSDGTDGDCVTSIFSRLPEGLLVIGFHSGRMQLATFGDGGECLVDLNPSASFVIDTMTRATEWIRQYTIHLRRESHLSAQQGSPREVMRPQSEDAAARTAITRVAHSWDQLFDLEQLASSGCTLDEFRRFVECRIQAVVASLAACGDTATAAATAGSPGIANRAAPQTQRNTTLTTPLFEQQLALVRLFCASVGPPPASRSPMANSGSLLLAPPMPSKQRASTASFLTGFAVAAIAGRKKVDSLTQMVVEPSTPLAVQSDGAATYGLETIFLFEPSKVELPTSEADDESGNDDEEAEVELGTTSLLLPKHRKPQLKVPFTRDVVIPQRPPQQQQLHHHAAAHDDFGQTSTVAGTASFSSQPRSLVKAQPHRPLSSPRHPRVPLDVHLRFGVGSREPPAAKPAVVDRGKYMASMATVTSERRLPDQNAALRDRSGNPEVAGIELPFGLVLPPTTRRSL